MNDERIEEFKVNYGKAGVNVGNCEDILTGVNDNVNVNETSQSCNNGGISADIIDKVIQMNQEYNNRIATLNEELVTVKAQTLLLEDKASREGLYLNEINQLKKDNERLLRVNERVFNISVMVIVILLLVIVGNFIFNVTSGEKKEHAQQEIINN